MILNLLTRNSAALVFRLLIFFLQKLNFLGGTNEDWNSCISFLQASISLAFSLICSAVPDTLVLARSTE